MARITGFAGGAFISVEQDAGGEDSTPDAFSFADQTGVPTSSIVISAPVTITGIDTTVTFTATGGTIDVNGDGDFQASRDVVSGDQIRARQTSSANYSTATDTVVEGGGVSDTFTSTTEAEPAPGSGSAIIVLSRRRVRV